jgi:hypothetical protein
MLIHSVAPLSNLLPAPVYPPLTTRRFAGGMLEGQETPEGFVLSRLYSTDPAMYLKSEYTPGMTITTRKKI